MESSTASKKPRSAQRKRAPRRRGVRKTLTVPEELVPVAQRMAAALGTTEADAVVRLASMGAVQYEREERLAKLASVRHESVLRAAPGPAVSYPPAEEARQAVLDAREHE